MTPSALPTSKPPATPVAPSVGLAAAAIIGQGPPGGADDADAAPPAETDPLIAKTAPMQTLVARAQPDQSVMVATVGPATPVVPIFRSAPPVLVAQSAASPEPAPAAAEATSPPVDPSALPVGQQQPPAAAAAPPPVAAPGEAPPAAAVVAAAPAAQPGTTTRAVTPDNPLRIYLMGDSFVSWLGYDLARFGGDGLATTQLESKLSSGLALPQFYNWPARLQQVMAEDPAPEAVVIFIGANDDKPLLTDDGTLAALPSDEWVDEYANRAGTMMDLAHQGGARVYWPGMPVMRDPRRNEAADRLNAAVQKAAQGRPWVRYIDIWTVFANSEGGYEAYLPGPDGEETQVRQADGVHLTQVGTRWVSDRVYAAIVEDWKLASP
jgi:hypothetical protein